MRITGGTARSRKLISPKTKGTNSIRPTSDRVREALFNILGKTVIDAHVLDLFAGTGSLGLEALSRGARKVLFVDQSLQSLNIIKRNVALCFPEAKTKFLRYDLTKKSVIQVLDRYLSGSQQFDLVFLDPPYEKKLAEMALTRIAKSGLLAPGALVIVEENAKISLPEQINLLQLHMQRRYGETGICIYQLQTESP